MPDTLPAAFAGLKTARPEEIGLEPSRLNRLTAAIEREIAAGRAPGVASPAGDASPPDRLPGSTMFGFSTMAPNAAP